MNEPQITDRDRDGFIILKRKYSSLYKRVNYLAPVTYVLNKVHEYDIRMANISVLRATKALPEKLLMKLEKATKKDRNVTIGNMIKENKDIQKRISKGIVRAKQMLFEQNNIVDADVLSIKNDAVFIIGRKLRITKFGPIEFVIKNSYSMYHKIQKLEFYYDRSNQSITVKGMDDAIVAHPDHAVGILEFLTTVFNYLIYDRMDALRGYLIDFTERYKSRQLPYQYYREMNHDNIYRLADTIDGYTFNMDTVNQEYVKNLNITYNYIYYILPIIQQYI